MFLPQVVTAIAASLLGAGLATRFGVQAASTSPGWRPTWSRWRCSSSATRFTSNEAVAYALLLLATAFLGVGFGLTVPALNTFTAAFHPDAVDRVGARAQRAARAGHGAGAGVRRDLRRARLLVGAAGADRVLLVGLLARQRPLPLQTGTAAAASQAPRAGIPSRFWLFAGVRGPLRHLRDDERQLGAARHDQQLGASTTHRVARADRLLGHGHRRPGRCSPRSERRFPHAAHLPPAAVRAGGRPRRRSRSFPSGEPVARRARLRPRRPRLLGAAAADDQLRPGASSSSMSASVAGGLIACYQLGLRHRRVRRRPAAGRRHRRSPTLFAVAGGRRAGDGRPRRSSSPAAGQDRQLVIRDPS